MNKTDKIFSNEKANPFESIKMKSKERAFYCCNGKNDILRVK